MKHYDIAIIGGGINGAGIARDAAGRGLNVLLCEQNDLASGTSSHSSQLIHGGLRYLEYGEFRLVRESLQERERLMRIAPHLITPLEFILPHQPQTRPAWLIRLGLFLYDHLTKHISLPRSKSLKLDKLGTENPLLTKFTKAFSYYDCQTNDARLVIANAQSARELGASILPRTECIRAIVLPNRQWQIILHDKIKRQQYAITASVLINATGPWLNEFNALAKQDHSASSVKLVKGSHIIVPKFYEGNHAYILQNLDKRVIFVIPYQQDYCLIGTTDLPYSSSIESQTITAEEIQYLCSACNRYFKQPLSPSDIIHSYSGLRALQADATVNPAAITRDYKIELLHPNNALYINIVGGKITTYRCLAEQVVNLIAPYFKLPHSTWTATQPISGGDLSEKSLSSYFKQLHENYPWLPNTILMRYLQQYGACCKDFLADCSTITDLGQHFAHGLYEIEIKYLISDEWAITADDILWRRTKLGLKFSSKEKKQLETFLFSYFTHVSYPDFENK